MADKNTFGHAIKWAYLMNCGEQGLSALISFVLVAIIGPGDFGIVAMAMVYILFLQMFLDQGLVAALIQRKQLDAEHLDSVFWLVLASGVLLMVVSLSFSPWWSAANHLPRLATVISLLSITIPIEALTVVQKALFQRDMDFKSLSIRSNVSFLVGGVIGVVMALTGFGPFALVGQRLSQDICALMLLWGLSHWRPRFRFGMKYIRDLLSFSVANFVAKLGVFANNQSEAFFMGLLFGPVAVGLYRFAQRVISLVSQAVVSSLQVTSFPQFSRLQDEPKELRNLVIFCLRISATLTMPLMAGIAGSSRLIFATVGAKWAAAAPVLGLLAVAGIIGALLPFTGPLLQARSKPHVLAILCWLDAAVVTAALVSVAMLLRKAPTSYQVAGVALARLGVTALIDAPLYLAFLFRESKMTLAEFGAATFPALTASSAIGLATFLLSYSGGLQNLPPAIGLVVCVGLSALVGGSILYAMDHQLRDWLRAVSRWTPVEQ